MVVPLLSIRRFGINSQLKTVNPFPKNQECGRDLTNFYFFSRSAVLTLVLFWSAYFWAWVFPRFYQLFARYAVLAFDDTKYLIICNVTMLQTRNNSNNTTKIHGARFDTRWL